jgi:ATP-binding cassette, subfamily F, member 3
MSLLVGKNVGKAYGADEIFNNIEFRVENQDRIGLVGVNGEGKTTLLNLIAGCEPLSAGQIEGKRELRLGYLPQDPPAMGGITLWQGMLEVFASLRGLESELAELAATLETAESPPQTLERYSRLQAEFERREGYTYENRIRTVLSGLGFDQQHYTQALDKFSGGQRTRAFLARLLLDQPDVLLLDEPTNHLDLEAVEWLEHWLQTYKGSLVIVSHDRYFLDKVTNRTWEIAFGGMEAYRGNYSAFLRQRQERFDRRMKEWQAQQEHIAKTEDFIRRFIAGQRTKEAQGRRKRLDRFKAEEAIAKPQRHPRLRVRLNPAKRSGDIVLQLRHLQAGYRSGEPIVSTPSVEVRRGDRIALVGPNGAGKTTLVRTILGELPALGGEVKHGAQVEPGYLAQAHDYLASQMTVVEAVRQAKPEWQPDRVRSLLGSFLFSGDEAFKRIDQLSGGQRSRVALARLAVQDANLLVLDEPTNHLDIASQEVLEDVLVNFPGTLIVVSHDRYLIQAVATHVWSAEAGRLDSFKGNWEEYIAWRTGQEPLVAGVEAVSDRHIEREAQKDARRRRKEIEQAARRHGEVEAEIAVLEDEMEVLSGHISAAGERQEMDAVRALGDEYRLLERQMARYMEEWEALAEVIEGEH